MTELSRSGHSRSRDGLGPNVGPAKWGGRGGECYQGRCGQRCVRILEIGQEKGNEHGIGKVDEKGAHQGHDDKGHV